MTKGHRENDMLLQAQGGVATVHPDSRGAGGQHGAVDLSAAHQKPLLIHAIRGGKVSKSLCMCYLHSSFL